MSTDDGVVYDDKDRDWRRLPASPLGARDAPQAWTGDGLFVWGGRSHTYPPGTGQDHDDGASFDPGTDRWTPVP